MVYPIDGFFIHFEEPLRLVRVCGSSAFLLLVLALRIGWLIVVNRLMVFLLLANLALQLVLHLAFQSLIKTNDTFFGVSVETGGSFWAPVEAFDLLFLVFSFLVRQIVPQHKMTLLVIPWRHHGNFVLRYHSPESRLDNRHNPPDSHVG